MDIEKVHPQFRNVIKRVPAMPFHIPLFRVALGFLTRLAPKAKAVDGVAIAEQQLANCSIRIYQPAGPLSGAGLLWIHGGGMIIGSASSNDRECAAYAKELKIIVVSVDYRLAPKHPFPCALDDCIEAWQWFLDKAVELGVDPARIAVSGQSAGGGLAASLAQRVHDEGGMQPAAQALFCPMLDDRTAAKEELDAVKHRIWNNKSNRTGWSLYLGQAAGASEAPEYAVPARRADLAGLPAAWIGIGDIDLFYEEDCIYARRLQEAGVSCQLEVAPMAPHAFETFVPAAQVSREYMASNYAFLRSALSLG